MCPQNVRTLSGLPGAKSGCPEHLWWAVSIGPFQVGRSRLRRMRFAMGIQSYFCCLTASLLPGKGVVERRSGSQWLHYAPAVKVLRIEKPVYSQSEFREVQRFCRPLTVVGLLSL